MLQSMTAYGQSLTSQTDGSVQEEFNWEMRSVNHRYLDVSVHLPVGFRAMATEVRAKVAELLGRGKIDISLTLGVSTKAREDIVVDKALLSQLKEAIDAVRNSGIETGVVDPLSLLKWPGLTQQEATLDTSIAAKALLSFDACLIDFNHTRMREGEQIALMLSARAQSISQLVSQLRERRLGVVQRQRARLIEKLAQLEIDHDTSRLEQELVYTAQRLDIDEELDRLDVHVVEFHKALLRTEPVGRRLDFLMQEFNREVNTVASKSSDSATTAATIELKVLIEQMREQVQNVE